MKPILNCIELTLIIRKEKTIKHGHKLHTHKKGSKLKKVSHVEQKKTEKKENPPVHDEHHEGIS